MKNRKGTFASVDLGSSQFVVTIAEQGGSSVEVAGVGKASAQGLERGMLTDISAASGALRSAVREAEVQAGDRVSAAIVGVSGEHLAGEDKRAGVKIQGGAATQGDVDHVLDTLQAYPIPPGREILHVIQQSFAIDERGGVRQPLGMTGTLLEAEAHVITAQANALANIRSCLQGAGLRAARMAAAPLASALATTTADERDMGVIALDWGAGTCEISVFRQGVLRSLLTLPQGCDLIDFDVAKTFRIPVAESKRIKRAIGSAVQVPQSVERIVEVSAADGSGTIEIDAHVLSMTIEARVEEMLGSMRAAIDEWRSGGELGGGIVMTGGGATLDGIREMAHEVLGMPVRIGAPSYAGTHHEDVAGPEFAAAMGLLMLHSEAKAAARPAPDAQAPGIFSRLLAAFAPSGQAS